MHGPLNAKIHSTSSPMCVGGSLHGTIKFPEGETYNTLPCCSKVSMRATIPTQLLSCLWHAGSVIKLNYYLTASLVFYVFLI